jgi:hypothetical protein
MCISFFIVKILKILAKKVQKLCSFLGQTIFERHDTGMIYILKDRARLDLQEYQIIFLQY